jgi:hypothetical protein
MPSARQVRDFEAMYLRIREDIFAFCAALNFKPTNQQRRLLQAVQDASMGRLLPSGDPANWIACKSGQGPGKTTATAVASLWRAFRSFNARGVITAPTMRQCKDVWLVEVRARLEAAEAAIRRLFNVTKTKVEIMGREDWGITLATATREENAQGYHNPDLFVVVEEASGVGRNILTQFKGTLSNPKAMLLAIGNPNTRDCGFFDCFFGTDKERWVRLTFNAEDTARDYPWIVSPQRNRDLEREFGRDSDVYRVRVLGEFPHTDPKALFNQEDLMECSDPASMVECARIMDGPIWPRQISLDFARFGGDENTVYRRQGEAIVESFYRPNVEPSVAVEEAFRMQREAYWKDSECLFVPDSSGIGQGLLHLFYDSGKRVMEWHNGGSSPLPGFKNLATSAWFSLRTKVRHHKIHGGKPRIYLPRDPTLFNQLSQRFFFMTKDGLLVLEGKDEYMKRGHESPDRADGAVQAFWDESLSQGRVSEISGSAASETRRRIA